MSIERTIVQRLFESKDLHEAEFQAGGSRYYCAFGKYYKDGEQISREDYFKAKETGSGGSSAPTVSAPSTKKTSTKSAPVSSKEAFSLSDDMSMPASEVLSYMEDEEYEEYRAAFSDYSKALGCSIEDMSLIQNETEPEKYEELVSEVQNLKDHGGYSVGTIRGVPVALVDDNGYSQIYFPNNLKSSSTKKKSPESPKKPNQPSPEVSQKAQVTPKVQEAFEKLKLDEPTKEDCTSLITSLSSIDTEDVKSYNIWGGKTIGFPAKKKTKFKDFLAEISKVPGMEHVKDIGKERVAFNYGKYRVTVYGAWNDYAGTMMDRPCVEMNLNFANKI